VLHGVRVRVSPSAPNLKKADFMSAFFMSEIYLNAFLLRNNMYLEHIYSA
jgi:hypothetical protein